MSNPNKMSWPELVGFPAAQAASQINKDRSDVSIEVIPVGTNVAPGYDAFRVRVYFDTNGNVASIPMIG